jgi:hypothetical protein
MTVVAALALVALVAAIALFSRDRDRSEARWTLERRELLNRIQRPEMVPLPTAEGFVVPERLPDEWAQVGQIDIDPEWGLSDEDG